MCCSREEWMRMRMREAEKKKYVFGKNDTLLVKGVAILMMIYHHCFLDEERFAGHEVIPTPLSMEMLMNTSNFCKLCVALFVFLSAYGMTISLKKMKPDMQLSASEFTSYTKKRYFNLMQGWLFVFAFCQLFCWFYAKYQPERYGVKEERAFVYFILDGLGLADLFHTPTLIATWWYMSLASIIIVIFPVLILLYKKIGSECFLLCSFILPRVISISYEPLQNWLLVIAFGIVFADKDLLVCMREKSICENKYMDKAVKLVICIAALLLSLYFREECEIGFLYEFRHGILCLFVLYMIYEFVSPIKYLNSFLRFAGKHSMNIFLIHSFIRHTFFNEFTYSFKYPIVIVAVLFSISLVLSIVIELLKKITGYNRLVEMLRKKWF